MKKLIFLLIVILFSNKSYALVEVDITRGNLDPLPIAVSPLYVEPDSVNFNFENINEKTIGDEISKVIETNLKRSGLFNPIKKESFVQNRT